MHTHYYCHHSYTDTHFSQSKNMLEHAEETYSDTSPSGSTSAAWSTSRGCVWRKWRVHRKAGSLVSPRSFWPGLVPRPTSHFSDTYVLLRRPCQHFPSPDIKTQLRPSKVYKSRDEREELSGPSELEKLCESGRRMSKHTSAGFVLTPQINAYPQKY